MSNATIEGNLDLKDGLYWLCIHSETQGKKAREDRVWLCHAKATVAFIYGVTLLPGSKSCDLISPALQVGGSLGVKQWLLDILTFLGL